MPGSLDWLGRLFAVVEVPRALVEFPAGLDVVSVGKDGVVGIRFIGHSIGAQHTGMYSTFITIVITQSHAG